MLDTYLATELVTESNRIVVKTDNTVLPSENSSGRHSTTRECWWLDAVQGERRGRKRERKQKGNSSLAASLCRLGGGEGTQFVVYWLCVAPLWLALGPPDPLPPAHSCRRALLTLHLSSFSLPQIFIKSVVYQARLGCSRS